MKNVSLPFLLIVLLSIGVIFTSCSKDDSDVPIVGPEDITIAIDDNSSFNMTNFITSFEQMFMPEDKWMVGFMHEFNEGKAINSVQYLDIYGDFGQQIFRITHNYDSRGIIISSERFQVSDYCNKKGDSGDSDNSVLFEYEYDIDGYIVLLKKYRYESLRDEVRFTYDDQKRIILKEHIEDGDVDYIETFTYTSNGYVYDDISYYYTNGLMTKMVRYGDPIYLEYDSKGRLTKYTDDDEITVYEYTNDYMTETEYYSDKLKSVSKYSIGHIQVSYSYYSYKGEEFEYCKYYEYDENEDTKKKYYYEGSNADNLELLGYTVIDSRDAEKDNIETKESIYDSEGNKLFYFEYALNDSGSYWEISECNLFNADGEKVSFSELPDWVYKLIYIFD